MPSSFVPRSAGFRAAKGPSSAPDPVPAPRARTVLLVSLALGALLFLWQLGSSGLVDETPPLFAASARAMAESGDWLIPHVNGLPRYDKPPLVYWAMGLIYALPAQNHWDPLGTWAARLPSALATVVAMQALVVTLLRWPQGRRQQSLTALGAGLAFALSPLVLLWGRIAVSDALLTGTLALSLLLIWHSYAAGGRRWWAGWLVLGLAVLTKGPVAVVLLGLTLVLFAALQADWRGLWRSLRPLRGLLLTALVALPWYVTALVVEGEPFWRSFFGYHNLQRFTSVVNDHQAPWWFFGLVLVVASLPLTPLLLQALVRAPRGPTPPPPLSLQRFAACWLLAVLLFFSAAATKLPSYWLPAIPAAALLIALAAQRRPRLAWRLCVLLALLLAAAFAAAPLWVPLIVTPEMPELPAALLASGRLAVAAACFGLAAALALVGWRRGSPAALLALQLPLVLFVPLALLPLWQLGDQLRGEPVRRLAAVVVERSARSGAAEPLAMVGMLKPSLHFYGRRVVIYEGAEAAGLVNLAERLAGETRQGQVPSSARQQPHLLLVIDADTAAREHWRELDPELLDQAGIYRLWRLDRRRLEQRASALEAAGVRADWRDPRPERY
ncbi:glycosyltransferase family 39 protein [Cyanobium sp. ATX 6A2]|uniref:ArnT family glycosyltransferase n=1 Tax=Cyanobium sp. ATX 6A2 TaxID=2823700 RepID=UPI0037C08294|nr:glycosyltransferase family 39 protein [Cyanobium sp. ATX 6A2]